MGQIVGKSVATSLVLLLIAAATAFSQPQPVPKLTERPLDRASYVELAKQWREYIDTNGESAEALVNLGMAHEYSGEMEAALVAANRAVEIAPDHPMALAFLGKLLSKYKDKKDAAIELIERCRKVAPNYDYGITTLAAIYLARGEFGRADEVFETMFDQRHVSRPLQDFAYNMLVGLPQGAVLITNGDADTFPPLALQVGMEFRRDVALVNRQLLNYTEYVEAILERYPSVRTKGEIAPEKGLTLPETVIKRMVDDPNIPVYFASSVPIHRIGIELEVWTEGINMRTMKRGLTDEESARLFLEKYRLDSATDWNFAWSLTPAVSGLLSNYVSSMIQQVNNGGLSPDTKKKLLNKALDIAEFHDMDRLITIIRSLQDA